MRPVIGITCAIENEGCRYILAMDYVRAVENAGGLPLLIPCLQGPEEALAKVGGLLLTGGDDIDSRLFDEEALPEQRQTDPRRDRSELVLAKCALKQGIPLLGICYGMQIINLAAGGKLYQDIQRAGFVHLQHEQHAPRWTSVHKVKIIAGSLLHSLAGREELMVNSFHHQAVAAAGKGLIPSGFSSDGLIEAVEAEHGFVMGVQWHPEALRDDDVSAELFAGLVRAAADKNGEFS